MEQYIFYDKLNNKLQYPESLTSDRSAIECKLIGSIFNDISLAGLCMGINENDFLTREGQVFFTVLKNAFIKNVSVIDYSSVDSAIGANELLRHDFSSLGGISSLIRLGEFVGSDNFDVYLEEFKNSTTRLRLFRFSIDLHNSLCVGEFSNNSSIDMYSIADYKLSNICSDVADSSVINLGVTDEFLKDCYEGLAVGTSYGLPLTSENTLGLHSGNLSMIAMFTSLGKTTLGFSDIAINIIEQGQQFFVYSNESYEEDFMELLLITVLDRRFDTKGERITRRNLKTGNVTEEQKILIKQAQQYINEHYKPLIYFKSSVNYSVKEFEMLVRQYAYKGCKHFFIDTMKSEDAGDRNSVGKLVQQSKDLYGVARKMDVHILASYQIASRFREQKRRILDESCLSGSKQVVEVLDILLCAREVYDDEYEGMDNEIYAFKYEKIGNQWIEKKVILEPNREYRVMFFAKNRYGKKGISIVLEYDGDVGRFIEVGYCKVSSD